MTWRSARRKRSSSDCACACAAADGSNSRQNCRDDEQAHGQNLALRSTWNTSTANCGPAIEVALIHLSELQTYLLMPRLAPII